MLASAVVLLVAAQRGHPENIFDRDSAGFGALLPDAGAEIDAAEVRLFLEEGEQWPDERCDVVVERKSGETVTRTSRRGR